MDPSQLMVSDIEMVEGRIIPETWDDNAPTWCATHIRFQRITNVESEDDEMEDVQLRLNKTLRVDAVLVCEGCSPTDPYLCTGQQHRTTRLRHRM